MTSTADTSARPLRRDAARNRQLLLDAGREVFAARGLDATLDDVAQHAGVGVGTAYRHFGNKQELAVAIFSDDFAQLVAAAHDALDVTDPWQGLVQFVETIVTKNAHDRGLYEAFTGQHFDEQPTVQKNHKPTSLRDALTEPVTELVERAKANGCLRADVAPSDVAAIFLMMGKAYALGDVVDRPVWRRYLAVLLDGLRATDRGPLPEQPLTIDELDTALAEVKHHGH